MQNTQRIYRTSLAVNLGLVANILLAALKTAVGIIGHSPALLAEGVNSTSDIAYYVVVAVFMRLARKPADVEHPYGHSQLESIASLLVGAFIMTTGIAVFWDAVNNVYDLWVGASAFSGAASGALIIALLTVGLKIILTFFTRRLARQTSNPAVLALAYDHRNDTLSAAAASLGIFLGRQGYPWVDPLVGGLVALLILRTGVEIVRQASVELMDTVPSLALAEEIGGQLAEMPEVLCVEEIHAHRFGPYFVVNLTIAVDGNLTVAAGDQIASQVEQRLYESNNLLRRVYVHYHPVSQDNQLGRPKIRCDLG